MDRPISEEERLQRAEEVLERRKNTNLRISSDNFVKEKSNKKIRKMFIQIFVCLLIYCGIYYAKNSENENVKGALVNIKSALEYDVDFKQIYESMYEKYKSINVNANDLDGQEIPEEFENEDNNNTEENMSEESDNNEENTSEGSENLQDTEESIETTETLGIGGSTEYSVDQTSDNSDEESQMLADAEYIKANFSIINPLSEGVVTSRFGTREATEIVSANHKGIDLGAATGTIIISAMEGTVIEASSEGDFGLHLKIANEDVTIIYAHCSELLVEEGDVIAQGVQIAKVGSTGKATGPHLHFEIRREGRAVNPEYILQF